MENNNHFDAIVIGGGPAGLTAGIYLSRARLKTLIINEGTVGGQMVLTHEIANYPGVESISGYQLSNIMKKQAVAFGCQIKSNVKVSRLELEGEVKSLSLSDGQVFTANSIILSPGGRSRTLGVHGEDNFKGKGISYCATCDGDFFTDKEIVVVGGGNTWNLLRNIHDNKLTEPIRKKVLSGTKYIGWSAGSNLACPTLKTTNDMPIVDPKGFDALNLIPFQINPHYLDKNPEGHGGETREDRILEFLEANKEMTVVGLREGCMFVVKAEKIEYKGKLPLRIFKHNKAPFEMLPTADFSQLLKI